MLVGILKLLLSVSPYVVIVDVLLLVASIVPRARVVTGTGIVVSSFIFGSATWLLGLLMTWELWGGLAVLVGLCFFGVGPVFMAMVATLFKARWSELATLVIWLAFTVGARLIGYAIAQAAPAEKYEHLVA